MLSLPAGAYTLTVSASGQTTGAYSFRLLDLSQATALTPGTPVSGTFSPRQRHRRLPLQRHRRRLRLLRPALRAIGSDYWRLIDPYGNLLFGTALSTDGGRLTLAATGTYTVLVEGGVADTTAASYSFNVVPVSDSTQPLALGATVSASLAAPGEQDRYTFSLAAPSLLYFDSMTNNSNLRWSLAGPGGTLVSNRAFTASDGSGISGSPALALLAGAYTLTVSGAGQTTGAYAFRLSDLASAAPLTLNAPTSGRLSPANSTNLYQFTANAGDSFYFESTYIPFSLGTSSTPSGGCSTLSATSCSTRRSVPTPDG